jgi:hypothetical protein
MRWLSAVGRRLQQIAEFALPACPQAAAWPPAVTTMTKPLRWRGSSLSSLGAAAPRRRERPL